MSLAISRLFSWVDVEIELHRAITAENWPTWLNSVDCYWDGVSLRVGSTKIGNVREWLISIFGPRVSGTSTNLSILLDSVEGQRRELPVVIDHSDKQLSLPFRFSFDAPTSIVRNIASSGFKFPSDEEVPIVAFHSFKGGVGRTTAALALALEFVSSKRQKRVLLIDADMEAPGITYLLDERVPNPPFCFADLLALAHGDESGTYDQAIDIAKSYLLDSVIDGIVVLPAFRSSAAYENTRIRPEHLVRNSDDPFVLSSLLRRLGKAINVDAIIVDLRAGISEVSAGLILDPTVRRVFVTSLSGQSIKGTASVLEKIVESDRHFYRLAGTPDKQPSGEMTVLISQVQDEQRGQMLDEAQQQLFARIAQFEPSDNEEKMEPRIIVGRYDGNLVALSRSWKDCISKIQKSDLGTVMKSVLDFLFVPDDQTSITINLDAVRRRIADLAKQLQFAETGSGDQFLITNAISHLTQDHKSEPPVVAMVGQKGAGKSYTFLQLIRRLHWKEFLSECRAGAPNYDAPLWPLLQPINLGADAQGISQRARDVLSSEMGFKSRFYPEVLEKIRQGLSVCTHESEWREYWLNILGYAAGFKLEDGFNSLLELLNKNNRKVIFAIDGLEDIFQDIWVDTKQQIALRSLLQDVLTWISQIPGRPVGLITFVRRDMVQASIKQNSQQFLQRHSPYELKWNDEEALKLVYWLGQQSGAFKTDKNEVEDLSIEKVIEMLVPFWGLKLGAPRAREAHTSEWVMSVLSDFKGQVQARDVVRLVRVAASLSIEDRYWGDRVLTPVALRKAPSTCGKEKVEEIEEENPALRELLERLRLLDVEKKVIPFTVSDVGLESKDIDLLEKSGVVLREDDGYYMPEMFRHGLGFNLKYGARPRVITLARRARFVS